MEKLTNPIYARDLNTRILNDSFFGIGFEKMLNHAEKEGMEIVVGYFIEKPRYE